jgi:hypothetical protein
MVRARPTTPMPLEVLWYPRPSLARLRLTAEFSCVYR